MHRLQTWAVCSIMPAAALLIPVLGFLAAVTVGILISVLKDADGPTLATLAAAAIGGWSLHGKLRGVRRNSASIEGPARRSSARMTPHSAS